MAWACQHPRFPNPILRGRDGWSALRCLRAMLGDPIFLFCCRCPPPSTWKRIPVQKVGCCIFLRWTSPPVLRVYGMRASPKSSLASGAHTVMTIGTRRTLRLSLPLKVWYRAGARWRKNGILPIVSWIC
ncbi:hypothetical protein TcCL_Unassigned02210 [Trypanosoma cruzi]|nr:hypothetical protein TcCL_Unassigned02210 [Trypanosoma cruzi]